MIQYHTPSNHSPADSPHMCDPGGDQYSTFRIIDTSVVETPLDNSHPLPVIFPPITHTLFYLDQEPVTKLVFDKHSSNTVL